MLPSAGERLSDPLGEYVEAVTGVPNKKMYWNGEIEHLCIFLAEKD